MTTITIPDAILSQIQPGEQAVEVCDATTLCLMTASHTEAALR